MPQLPYRTTLPPYRVLLPFRPPIDPCFSKSPPGVDIVHVGIHCFKRWPYFKYVCSKLIFVSNATLVKTIHKTVFRFHIHSDQQVVHPCTNKSPQQPHAILRIYRCLTIVTHCFICFVYYLSWMGGSHVHVNTYCDTKSSEARRKISSR